MWQEGFHQGQGEAWQLRAAPEGAGVTVWAERRGDLRRVS